MFGLRSILCIAFFAIATCQVDGTIVEIIYSIIPLISDPACVNLPIDENRNFSLNLRLSGLSSLTLNLISENELEISTFDDSLQVNATIDISDSEKSFKIQGDVSVELDQLRLKITSTIDAEPKLGIDLIKFNLKHSSIHMDECIVNGNNLLESANGFIEEHFSDLLDIIIYIVQIKLEQSVESFGSVDGISRAVKILSCK